MLLIDAKIDLKIQNKLLLSKPERLIILKVPKYDHTPARNSRSCRKVFKLWCEVFGIDQPVQFCYST